MQQSTYVEGFHNKEAVGLMKYIKLGNTNMVVSKLSLGGGPFGDMFNSCSQEIVDHIVAKSLKNGMNYIDTAYWYGQGKSEQRLGNALSNIPRSAYYISTKVCRYEADKLHRFNFRGDKAVQSLENSLIRLKLPYVDIVQIHDVEFAEDEKIIIEETLPALQRLKEIGKARYIGITGYPLSTLCSILGKSVVPIDTVLTYARATLHDNCLTDALPIFQTKNVGVINGGAVSLGLLTPTGAPAWHPAQDHIKKACRQAIDYCQNAGVSIAKLAIKYSMNFPGVHTTLVGMDKTEVLDECLHTATTELNNREKECMKHMREKIFVDLKPPHWEGVETKKYFDFMKQHKQSPK